LTARDFSFKRVLDKVYQLYQQGIEWIEKEIAPLGFVSESDEANR
jgi:hypothetical protein